ncbi:MAG: DUF4240 domain-containing protein [Bacteroidota bacterium]
MEKLRTQVGNDDQEVTIWFPQKSTALSENTFWEIIDLLDWQSEDSANISTRAITKISQLSVAEIQAFDDILSEKLYLLDGKEYAENTGQNAYKSDDAPFSVDGFLYARCMAVASGKITYEEIVEDPARMIKNSTFEPLLSLASRAYKLKTGKIYEHNPAYIYETFANTKGWDNKDFLSTLLH